MTGYSLRPIGVSGDQFRLYEGAAKVGIIYREPDCDQWAVCPSYGSPDSPWDRIENVPARLRDAASEWFPTLHHALTAIGITGA